MSAWGQAVLHLQRTLEAETPHGPVSEPTEPRSAESRLTVAQWRVLSALRDVQRGTVPEVTARVRKDVSMPQERVARILTKLRRDGLAASAGGYWTPTTQEATP